MSNNKEIPERLIYDAVERITGTDAFRRSARQTRFLKFLISESLAGRGDKIKGYAIGMEVFDKGKDFNPDEDTIVRVYAGRLRRMLEIYYLTTGKNDPVVIEVPKGSYMPVFRLADNHRPIKKPFWRRPLPLFFIAVFAALAGFSAYVTWSFFYGAGEVVEKEVSNATVRLAKQIPEGASIAVLPFTNSSRGEKNESFTRGLATQIIINLTRFKDLFVLGPDTTLNNPAIAPNIIDAGKTLRVQYVLSGNVVETPEKILVTARLLETANGRVVWSKAFKRIKSASNLFDIQFRISSLVASTLGQPYGIINRLERRHRMGSDNISMSAYSCYLRSFDYAQNENARTHLEIRNCLEQAVIDAPGFAPAWAALSWMYVNEHRQGYNLRIGDKPALDRALEAARKAVELDPDDAVAHQRLADTLITRGDKQLAYNEIMHAMELNPNSADIIADVGWILKTRSKWAEAYWLTRKAIRLNPGHPPWYLETVFLYYYKNLDCKNTRPVASSHFRLTSESLLPHVYKILVGAMCGTEDEIMNSVNLLNTGYPDFLYRPRKTLITLATPEELVDTIIADLEGVGVRLKIPDEPTKPPASKIPAEKLD